MHGSMDVEFNGGTVTVCKVGLTLFSLLWFVDWSYLKNVIRIDGVFIIQLPEFLVVFCICTHGIYLSN